jgi:hypothetical protein
MAIVTSIWPNHGPSTGGTMIEVSGTGIYDDAMCFLFTSTEQIKIKPIWVTTELILCELPAHTAQIFRFEL